MIATSSSTVQPATAEDVTTNVSVKDVPVESTMAFKKRKKTINVRAIDDIRLAEHVITKDIIKSTKCNIVPLACATNNRNAVLVQLSGGGKIPLSFGIKDEDENGKKKIECVFGIGSKSDHEHLDRIRRELCDIAIKNWPTWYPETDPDVAPLSDEVIRSFCNNITSIGRKKNNSEERWPGLSKGKILPSYLENGKCKIVDHETGEPVHYSALPGRVWNKIILELSHIYIQGTKKYGLTSKIRYLSSSAEYDGMEEEEIIPLWVFSSTLFRATNPPNNNRTNKDFDTMESTV